jgi:hypothetical protein
MVPPQTPPPNGNTYNVGSVSYVKNVTNNNLADNHADPRLLEGLKMLREQVGVLAANAEETNVAVRNLETTVNDRAQGLETTVNDRAQETANALQEVQSGQKNILGTISKAEKPPGGSPDRASLRLLLSFGAEEDWSAEGVPRDVNVSSSSSVDSIITVQTHETSPLPLGITPRTRDRKETARARRKEREREEAAMQAEWNKVPGVPKAGDHVMVMKEGEYKGKVGTHRGKGGWVEGLIEEGCVRFPSSDLQVVEKFR